MTLEPLRRFKKPHEERTRRSELVCSPPRQVRLGLAEIGIESVASEFPVLEIVCEHEDPFRATSKYMCIVSK